MAGTVNGGAAELNGEIDAKDHRRSQRARDAVGAQRGARIPGGPSDGIERQPHAHAGGRGSHACRARRRAGRLVSRATHRLQPCAFGSAPGGHRPRRRPVAVSLAVAARSLAGLGRRRSHRQQLRAPGPLGPSPDRGQRSNGRASSDASRPARTARSISRATPTASSRLIVDFANPRAIAPDLSFLADTRVGSTPIEVELQCTASGACERDVRSQAAGVTDEQAEEQLFGVSTDPVGRGRAAGAAAVGRGPRDRRPAGRSRYAAAGAGGKRRPVRRSHAHRRRRRPGVAPDARRAPRRQRRAGVFTESRRKRVHLEHDLLRAVRPVVSRAAARRSEPFARVPPRAALRRVAPRPDRASARRTDRRRARSREVLGFPERELRGRLKLTEGDRFQFAAWQRDRDRLADLYETRGFLEARIRARRHSGRSPGVDIKVRNSVRSRQTRPGRRRARVRHRARPRDAARRARRDSAGGRARAHPRSVVEHALRRLPRAGRAHDRSRPSVSRGSSPGDDRHNADRRRGERNQDADDRDRSRSRGGVRASSSRATRRSRRHGSTRRRLPWAR